MRATRVITGTVTLVIGGSSFVASGRYGALVIGLALVLAFILLLIALLGDGPAGRLGMLLGRQWWRKPPDSAPPPPASPPASKTSHWRRRPR